MWKSLDSQLRVILSLGDTWQFLGAFWLPTSPPRRCIPNRKSALRSWLLYTALLFLSPGQQGADRGQARTPSLKWNVVK